MNHHDDVATAFVDVMDIRAHDPDESGAALRVASAQFVARHTRDAEPTGERARRQRGRV
jgi:hypothetical protein